MKAGAKFIVQGSVQGVFYRQFVKENADLFNLRGHVRNLSNSDVEIVVEGDDKEIDGFFKIIQKGPKHSQIRHIQIEKKKWSGDFKEFKVLRF